MADLRTPPLTLGQLKQFQTEQNIPDDAVLVFTQDGLACVPLTYMASGEGKLESGGGERMDIPHAIVLAQSNPYTDDIPN